MASSSVAFVFLATLVAGARLRLHGVASAQRPAATPVGGSRQLNSGDTWTFGVPTSTSSGRVWARTGCSLNSNDMGSCQTGDCAGALYCTLSGKNPMTLAEFTIGGVDSYDISVIDSFNVGMAFSCSTSTDVWHHY